MVDSKENNKFNLGVKGLKNPMGLGYGETSQILDPQ